MKLKPVTLTRHAQVRMEERGLTRGGRSGCTVATLDPARARRSGVERLFGTAGETGERFLRVVRFKTDKQWYNRDG